MRRCRRTGCGTRMVRMRWRGGPACPRFRRHSDTATSRRQAVICRPGILRGALERYDPAQHEADHCQDDEANMAAGEILVVLGEPAAAAEPAVCALDNPALGQQHEPLDDVNPLMTSERLTISSGMPAWSCTSSAVALPWKPPSAMAFSIDGKRLHAIARSGAIMLRSCTSAGVTARLIRSPSVSTTVWRFFPLIFLPASYPTESTFGPLFLRFSRSGYRRSPASA
jgi:hypothetical protein